MTGLDTSNKRQLREIPRRGVAKSIPRDYRTDYISGWNERRKNLYQEFVVNNDHEIEDELSHRLGAARREKWMNTAIGLDFSKSSREAWTLLRNLGDRKKRISKKKY